MFLKSPKFLAIAGIKKKCNDRVEKRFTYGLRYSAVSYYKTCLESNFTTVFLNEADEAMHFNALTR